MIRFTIPRMLYRLVAIAAEEASRYLMNAIELVIDPETGQCSASATDGKHAFRIRWLGVPIDCPPDQKPQRTIIMAKWLSALLLGSTPKRPSAGEAVIAQLTDERLQILGVDQGLISADRMEEGNRFPKVDDCFPSEKLLDEAYLAIDVDAHRLALLCRAMVRMGGFMDGGMYCIRMHVPRDGKKAIYLETRPESAPHFGIKCEGLLVPLHEERR